MNAITRRISSNWLFTEVDNSPLVLFRMFFGLLVFAEGIGAIATGWVYRVFVTPEFTFSFIGFEWLQPLPGNGMYVYYIFIAISGLSISLGYRYRTGAILFALLWTGSYLMQKTSYNNHYYLMVLLAWLMFFLPANRRFSLDVKFERVKKEETCWRICHKVFVMQVALVYIVASLNKISTDWLSAEPISIWFTGKRNYPLIGELLNDASFQLFIAIGGIFYDGLITIILLFRKSRKLGLILSIIFNLFNSIVFQIGIFPYLMIAFSLFFYAPEQISKFFFRQRIPAKEKVFQGNPIFKNAIFILFILFFTLQVFLATRHHLYKGDVHWTEEGHRMAWQMMLRSKVGHGKYIIVNKDTNERIEVNPRDYMTVKQYRKLTYLPDLIWQFSRRLERIYSKKGMKNISIHYDGKVKLNKGKYGILVDPSVDLLTVNWEPFKHSDWIIPYPPKR